MSYYYPYTPYYGYSAFDAESSLRRSRLAAELAISRVAT